MGDDMTMLFINRSADQQQGGREQCAQGGQGGEAARRPVAQVLLAAVDGVVADLEAALVLVQRADALTIAAAAHLLAVHDLGAVLGALGALVLLGLGRLLRDVCKAWVIHEHMQYAKKHCISCRLRDVSLLTIIIKIVIIIIIFIIISNGVLSLVTKEKTKLVHDVMFRYGRSVVLREEFKNINIIEFNKIHCYDSHLGQTLKHIVIICQVPFTTQLGSLRKEPGLYVCVILNFSALT